jgi:hypothetical protein
MKKIQLLTLILSAVLLSAGVTSLFYSFLKIDDVKHIPMDITVGDHIGTNVDADALHFGMVMKGGCSDRRITIKHEFDFPQKVVINVIGELQGWTSVDVNDFILDKNEEKEVKFKVCAPPEAIMDKEYTSTARIILMRA